MSTRATYTVKEFYGSEKHTQCFYMHHDGYPRGAATYFDEFAANLDSLIKDDRYRAGKTITAFGMLPYSEYTDDHEAHGDTEYRYDLCYIQEQGKVYLKAYTMMRLFNDDNAWGLFFDGELQEFVSKYLNEVSP